MSNSSKSERKEDRLQQLERQLAEQKKKNAELQKQKTIRLDDEQVDGFLKDLAQRIEWSTNRIVDETPRSIIVKPQENQKSDGFSYFIKWSIAILFFTVAIAIAYSLYSIWGEFWDTGWANRVALFIVAIAGFDCAVLGIEILKEKDRNYIISLFSALVALVALIVALIK